MFQLFCILSLILYLSHNNAALPKRRNLRDSNLEVDDFIDKLLASEKFRKVTDELISKTVDKLNSMDHKVNYRNSKEKENKNNEEKLNNVNHTKEKKESKETGPVVIGKIYTKDFFEDKSSEKLLLHSKHFNKELNKDLEVDNEKQENTPPSEADKVKPSTNELETFDEPIKVESGDKSSIEENNDSYDEQKKMNMNDKASSFEDRKDKNPVPKQKKFKIAKSKTSNDDRSKPQKIKLRSEKNRSDKSSEVETTTGTTEKTVLSNDKNVKKRHDASSETASDVKQKVRFRSKMSEIEIMNPATDKFKVRSRENDNHDEGHFHEDIFNSQENTEELKTTTPKIKKLRYREENGKNFTYNSSPEYNEYHEKLSQVKETTVNFANL